jgi:tetratricopeptide (TPR) repeat protein
MKIPFNTPARKRVVAAIAVTLAVVYLGFAASQLAAWWLGNPSRVELTSLTRLKRAALLDPGNAEYRDHLGRYYDLVARDPAAALGQYKTAVQLNPHSADYWFDLTGAYQVLGDTANQTAALERALESEPTKPDVAWTAANFYLVRGENDKALREFRVVLTNDPPLASSAIRFCWRIEPDVDALLRDVVPARSDAYIPFLSLLQTNQETAGAAKVWNALMQTEQPFERRPADEYFRYLIQHKEVNQAVQVWQQTAERFGLSSYLPSSGNLIVNGRFTLPMLGAGFDWQYQKQSGVRLTFDPNDVHPDPSRSPAGRQSLTITFDGPGIADAGIYQLIAVQPNTTYLLSAYYKNGEIQGAGGPHFTIQDMYSQAVYYESDELKDAGFWRSVDGEFTTNSDCQLVVLHVRRLPAGHPIRGKLWIDDFHVVRKPG